MRLIDADKLMGELHESLKGDCDLRKDYEFMGIDEFIENQPTAYNVDKVLEQLKNEKEFWSDANAHNKEIGEQKARSYEHAIEIVKGGGIDGNTNT